MTTVEQVVQVTARSDQTPSAAVRAIRAVNDVEMRIGQGLMFGIIVLVFVAAALRWFSYPLVWSIDMAQLLFLWTCWLGADQALIRNKHIGVDMLTRKFPPRLQKALLIATYLLTLGFFALVFVYGTELCIESRSRQFASMDVSYLWATLSAPVGSVLIAKTLVILLAEQFGLLTFTPSQLGLTTSAEQEVPQP